MQRGTLLEQVTLRATFRPANEVQLLFRVPGRVKAVNIQAGDTVAAGQVLAELETGDLEVRTAVQELNVRKAEIRLEQFKGRQQFQPGDPHEVEMLEIDLKSARLSLQALQQQLDAARLVAPFDGLMTAVALQVGDSVQAYNPVMTVADPHDLLIVTEQIDSGTMAKLSVGMGAMVDVPELGAPREATIVQLPNVGDPTDRGARLRLTTPSPEAGIGMSGKAEITLQERKDVLTVPPRFLRRYTGRTYVVVQQGEIRREVDIRLGIQTETEVEVVEGLQEGDRVVGQ